MATEQFHYDYAGDTIIIPHMRNIPAGLLRKVRKLDVVDGSFTILEELCDEATIAVLDRMPLHEFHKFQQKWEDSSGTPLGESSAS